MSRNLSTRELLTITILCAEKSIKDFSCIQKTMTGTRLFDNIVYTEQAIRYIVKINLYR